MRTKRSKLVQESNAGRTEQRSREELKNFSQGVLTAGSIQGIPQPLMVRWLQAALGSLLSVGSIFRGLTRRMELLRKSGRKDTSVPDNPITGTVFKARRSLVATLQPSPETAHYLQDSHLSGASENKHGAGRSSSGQAPATGTKSLPQYSDWANPVGRSVANLLASTHKYLPDTQIVSQWFLQFFAGRLVRLH